MQDDIKKVESIIRDLLELFKSKDNEDRIQDKLKELEMKLQSIAGKLRDMRPLLKKHKALLNLKEKKLEHFKAAFMSWFPTSF